jgi:hypothetical protein
MVVSLEDGHRGSEAYRRILIPANINDTGF